MRTPLLEQEKKEVELNKIKNKLAKWFGEVSAKYNIREAQEEEHITREGRA